MNKTSVPPQQFTVSFTPARVCCHCPRWTNTGLAEHDGHRSFSVQPYCPEHGYFDIVEDATPEARQLERASIERFVIWMMDEKGNIKNIEPCPVKTIPGYDEEYHTTTEDVRNGFLPKGWYVLYTLAGEEQHLHVVYDFVDWALTLYVDGKWVERTLK